MAANNKSAETQQMLEPAAPATAPAAADPMVSELKSIVVAQSKQISDLIGLMTAQATAKPAAAAPVPAPATQAPVVPTLMMPTRRDTYERDRKRVDAWTAEHDARLSEVDRKLKEGPNQYEVCIRQGATERDNISCPVRIVGASSEMEAKQKYTDYMGITGVTFPSQFFVKPLMPAGFNGMQHA